MRKLMVLIAVVAVCGVWASAAGGQRIPHTEVTKNPDGTITVTGDDLSTEIYLGVLVDEGCGVQQTNTCVYINSDFPIVPQTDECSFRFFPPFDDGEEQSGPTYSARCPRGPIFMSLGGGSDYVHWSNPALGGPVSVFGGEGDDRIEYGIYAGNLFGEGGSDVIKPYGYKERPEYGATFEDLTVMNGGAGDDLVIGDDADDETDKLVGGPGKDRLLGREGKDILVGSQGRPDLCNGGPGKDKGSKSCEKRVGIP